MEVGDICIIQPAQDLSKSERDFWETDLKRLIGAHVTIDSKEISGLTVTLCDGYKDRWHRRSFFLKESNLTPYINEQDLAEESRAAIQNLLITYGELLLVPTEPKGSK